MTLEETTQAIDTNLELAIALRSRGYTAVECVANDEDWLDVGGYLLVRVVTTNNFFVNMQIADLSDLEPRITDHDVDIDLLIDRLNLSGIYRNDEF